MTAANSRLPDATPTGDAVPEAEVDLEKTRLLFRNAGMAQTVVAINGGVLVFVLGGLAPPFWAVLWWLTVIAVAAMRYALARAFLKRDPPPAEGASWRRRAVKSAFFAGLLWGGGGMAMMIADPESTRLFAALVMAGMVAGAVPILSSVPGAFRAYAAPVMLAIILTAAVDAHGSRDWMLALVAVLYLLALLRSARYFHDSLDSSIRLALQMRHMAEQLEDARRDAEASSQAKSRFLAMMSHEIRTPMNGILGMAQVLLWPDVSEDERRDYAQTILNSGQTLLMLLNDILDFSKIEAGKLELTPAECEPGNILGETLALYGETARSKGLAIAAEWQGEAGAQYWADANRLRQMLSNLTNNAIKFTSHGFVRIAAREIARTQGEATLEFSVVDSGIGIPQEKLATLFQPFTQLENSNTRQFGGTGLGLSIVRLLAGLMGGEVGVDSEPGRGSRFWFQVRVKPLAPAVPAADADPAAMPATAPSRPRSGRILVVEDNLINQKVIGAMLTRRGFDTAFVENGQLAVEAVTGGGAPDLVLMDCQMPVMDGYDATAAIRHWERQSGNPRRIPIVAFTASAFDEDRDRCLEVGMDDFVTKPVTLATLDALVAKWLSAD